MANDALDSATATTVGGATPEPARALSPFEQFGLADVTDLIAEYPLAWVCPGELHAAKPSLLPLFAETDAEGNVVALIGHMARRNPLFAILTADPRAVLLFNGPQAYVSTALVTEPTWAPTWNYAQLRIDVSIVFEPENSGESVQRLLDSGAYEAASGWTTALMGERYGPMERAIIAFRAEVVRLEGRFKLGQDENLLRLREILDGHPDAALVRWMTRLNASRL